MMPKNDSFKDFPQVQRFLHEYQLKIPIIQAPMAGVDNNNLALSMAAQGGIGSRGVGYMNIAAMSETIDTLHAATSAFNINLFIPEQEKFDCTNKENIEKINKLQEYLKPYYQLLNVVFQPFTGFDPHSHFQEQLNLVMAKKVPILSITFGKLNSHIIEQCHVKGIKVFATATTLQEGIELADLGCDAIIAQGLQAGGHRGSFHPTSLADQMETLELVQTLVKNIDLPVVAAGGIRTSQDMMACFAAGACAVQLGTALLACRDFKVINAAYQQMLLQTEPQHIAITHVLSGRNAQGVQNELFNIMQNYYDQYPEYRLPFPYPHLITAPLRAAADKQINSQFITAWCSKSDQPLKFITMKDLINT